MRLIYLQCRNLGDAVIGTGFVEAMCGHEIEVLTRTAFVPIYANNPHVAAVHTASFPTGTNRRFTIGDTWHLLKQIFKLRHRRFDVAVSVTGDVREIFLGWLIAPKSNYGVEFAPNNAFGRAVRKGGHPFMTASAKMASDEDNIYGILSRLTNLFPCSQPTRQRLYDRDKKPIDWKDCGDVIGIHPSAGQECRRWPMEHWRELIRTLRKAGKNVLIFSAPNERAWLQKELAPVMDYATEIVTGDLLSFFDRLRSLEVLIGLDSFSGHAAYAVGTPAIYIAGPTPAQLFAPPTSTVMEGGPGLRCYPCYNKPTCLGRADQYACMTRTLPRHVLEKLKDLGAVT